MLIWNVKQFYEDKEEPGRGCDLMLIWNVKQFQGCIYTKDCVVIWCLFEMWNSSTKVRKNRTKVVIWCLFEMWNSRQADKS